ncbi:hypothetical protein [Desulfosporosinus lacus]|uniref:Uncharacterized protein n=1 Tax=Desulfosporosinus lacus DSM 15449 TaxID=1121420 RepID=A0A1M6EIX5_9FIRM|nr:hypothetical protein [Desulfosporosinus lacus]SHI85208.1 hypothetical protein SAMN02746098_04748 [Desulfosporosinus lacus DSM 15449]
MNLGEIGPSASELALARTPTNGFTMQLSPFFLVDGAGDGGDVGTVLEFIFGVCESQGKLPVHPRFRSLARRMLKEFRQPLGSAGCEPGRNWPFSIGTRFIVNSHEWVHYAIVPFLSGRRGLGMGGRRDGSRVRFGSCESQGKLPVHPRSRSLARWMLKEFRQPLGGAGCEPGRNWPFSIGTRFNVNSHEWVHYAIVPFLSGRLGLGTGGRMEPYGTCG